MEINLTPTRKQHEAYLALNEPTVDEVFLGGGAGGGKSWFICESRLVNAYRYPGYRSFIGREELKRLMQSTYVTWMKVCKHHKIPPTDWKLNGQYNFIEFINGSRIDLLDLKFTPSDPLYERYGSTEYSDGAIDEAGEIHHLAKDVLKSRIGRTLNKELGIIANLLSTGNPKKNWTKQEYYKPFVNGTLPKNKRVILSLYSDNPFTAEEYGKQLAGINNDVMRQRLKDGNWDYDEDQDALVTYDALSDCFSNTIIKDGQKYLIVDVARFGKDTTTINQWDGLELSKLDVFSKQDTQNTIQKVKDSTAINQIPWSNTMIDEDGIGGAVVDGMLGVKGFIANSSPIPTRTNIVAKQGVSYINDFIPKTNFRNLKTQCAFKLANLINEHKIKFNVPEYREIIIEELSALLRHKNADSDGKLQIKPKDEVKESLGRSPDIGDAIIMRMWYELKKDALAENAPEQERINQRKEEVFSRNKNNLKNYSNR